MILYSMLAIFVIPMSIINLALAFKLLASRHTMAPWSP